MVRHDGRDVEVQRSRPPAEEQVVEAVPEPAHHDDGPVGRRGVTDRPLHAVGRRHRREQPAPALRRRPAGLDREPDPHEELVGALVVELLALLDVRAVLEGGHRRDDAALVGAGQDQHVLGGVGHLLTVRRATRGTFSLSMTGRTGRQAARPGGHPSGHEATTGGHRREPRDVAGQDQHVLAEAASGCRDTSPRPLATSRRRRCARGTASGCPRARGDGPLATSGVRWRRLRWRTR